MPAIAASVTSTPRAYATQLERLSYFAERPNGPQLGNGRQQVNPRTDEPANQVCHHLQHLIVLSCKRRFLARSNHQGPNGLTRVAQWQASKRGDPETHCCSMVDPRVTAVTRAW